jgi:hypothetical protein
VRRLPTLVLLTLVGAFLAGCPKKKPSAEYERAHRLFSQVYAERLNEAFTDPRMAEVEALLTQVPEESLDAAAAAELRKRISDGKARQAKLAAEIRAAVAPPATGPVVFDARPAAAPLQAVEAGEGSAADAGSDQPVLGMDAAAFTSRFSSCFVPGESYALEGQGVASSSVLRDTAVCRQRHPAFVGRAALFVQGKLFGLGDLSRVERRYADGGLVRDAG